MAIYLGSSQKMKLNVGGSVCKMIVKPLTLIVNGILLKSSDNFILKDANGIYLTAKESE